MKRPAVEMNLMWFIFYGRKMNMGRQEVMCTPFGEMLDMIACLSIYNGAKPKRRKKRITDFDALRYVR